MDGSRFDSSRGCHFIRFIKMKKQKCNKCNHEFSLKGGNYNKHILSCNGSYTPNKKLLNCKYCGQNFEGLKSSERANHSRWCNENPVRNLTKTSKTIEQLHTPEAVARRKISLKRAHARGAYKDAAKKAHLTRIKNGNLFHSEKTKELLREKALKSRHRRILKSTRKYLKKDGSEVLLDSSWEEALAIRLDNLNIEWIRPDPIQWEDKNGTMHNYFPDFYLTDYDLYLDPKNDIVYNISQEKIEGLRKILPNLIIIRTLLECKNFSI